MFSRIKQGLTCLFSRYNNENDEIVKEILSSREFIYFDKMSDYDKIHSLGVYKKILKDDILKNDILYLKLGLLHDCGKGKVTLLRRVKKVLIGDKVLEKHPEEGAKKIAPINRELSFLILNHHGKPEDIKMERFQKIDDK